MSKQITVKYYTDSEFASQPDQTTEDSNGYGLFAEKTKTFLPKLMDTRSLDLRWAISTAFFGKLFLRSGILRERFVTIDAGVTDAHFRGVFQALVMNHHREKTFTVLTEDRIAQIVFMEKFNANLHRMSDAELLGKTKRGSDSFASTDVHVIKKAKKEGKIELRTSESEQATAQNSCKMLQIVCKKLKGDLQIGAHK